MFILQCNYCTIDVFADTATLTVFCLRSVQEENVVELRCTKPLNFLCRSRKTRVNIKYKTSSQTVTSEVDSECDQMAETHHLLQSGWRSSDSGSHTALSGLTFYRLPSSLS